MTRSVMLFAALAAVGSASPALARPHGDMKTFVISSASGGRLGVRVQSMTPELRRYFGAPEESGVLVEKVEADSAAAKAGVQAGDVITDVDGAAIDDTQDLVSKIWSRDNGDVKLGVIRDKRSTTLTATLKDRPAGSFHDGEEGPFPGVFTWHGGADDSKLKERIDDLEKRVQQLEKKK